MRVKPLLNQQPMVTIIPTMQIGHLFGAGLYTVEMVSQPIIDELKQKCRRLAHDFKLVSHVTVLNIAQEV